MIGTHDDRYNDSEKHRTSIMIRVDLKSWIQNHKKAILKYKKKKNIVVYCSMTNYSKLQTVKSPIIEYNLI